MRSRKPAVPPGILDDEVHGFWHEWAYRSGHLLRASANFSAERYAWARAGLEDGAALARESLRGTRHGFSLSMARATEESRRYVAQHPWRALAAALGIGMLAGGLMQAARRRGGVRMPLGGANEIR